MSGRTSIEWTDASWNPVRGCSRVSEGCRHCYAERIAARFSGPGEPYDGLASMRDGEPRWSGNVRLIEKHLLDPLHWKAPRRVFVNSMSDLFHGKVTTNDIDRIFAVMALTPQHTFQILTKRPERMRGYCLAPETQHRIGEQRAILAGISESELADAVAIPPHWPLPNVWLGTSVENQAAADERIPHLVRTPAAIRFISAEPLLGALSIEPWLRPGPLKPEHGIPGVRRVDWVIAGGESGPRARPMHPDWARDLMHQCQRAGVPFFFKQWGAWTPYQLDGQISQSMRPVGKKAAGRLLDGRTWDEFPEAARA
jgi:protein gp37